MESRIRNGVSLGSPASNPQALRLLPPTPSLTGVAYEDFAVQKADRTAGSRCCSRCPTSHPLFWGGEGSPAKIDKAEKGGYQLILTSLLEELVKYEGSWAWLLAARHQHDSIACVPPVKFQGVHPKRMQQGMAFRIHPS